MDATMEQPPESEPSPAIVTAAAAPLASTRPALQPQPSPQVFASVAARAMQQPPASPIESARSTPGSAARSLRLGQVPQGTPRRKNCNCKNSRCLKLYCECFASGSYCDGCNCQSCCNNIQFEVVRQAAVEATLEKNPNAFRPKVVAQPPASTAQAEGEGSVPRHNKGCNCKKSGCLKKYCECYQAGVPCGDVCKCVGCKNLEGHRMGLDGPEPSPGGASDAKRPRLSAGPASRPSGTPTSAVPAGTPRSAAKMALPAVPFGTPHSFFGGASPGPAVATNRRIATDPAASAQWMDAACEALLAATREIPSHVQAGLGTGNRAAGEAAAAALALAPPVSSSELPGGSVQRGGGEVSSKVQGGASMGESLAKDLSPETLSLLCDESEAAALFPSERQPRPARGLLPHGGAGDALSSPAAGAATKLGEEQQAAEEQERGLLQVLVRLTQHIVGGVTSR